MNPLLQQEEDNQSTIMQEINSDAKLAICYSRPRHIQDVLAKAALFEPEGKEVSKYITGKLKTIKTPPFYPLIYLTAYAVQ
jgi:hypothetical protein